MKENELNNEQKERIERIKELWMKEADEYFINKEKNKIPEDYQKLYPHLDGGVSPELLRIQRKYQAQIQEVLKESDM